MRQRALGGEHARQLCEILEDEFVALHGALPEGSRSWLLRLDQVVDPRRFAAHLRDSPDPLSAWLRSRLPASGDAGGRGATLPPTLDERSIDALNRVLETEELYAAERFKGVALSDRLRDLVARPREPAERVRVNRLLLEAAYPGEIRAIDDVRLAALYQRVHALPADRARAALCLSGGGIRSATFALGVLQGLARGGLLDRFHYLSTVSGGGYVGSWLTGWIHRHPQGLPGVIEELRRRPTSPLDPEPEPVRHLRAYSNYLSPKLGLLSADTWALIGTYLRNLILNWCVIVPLLVAALMVPRIGAGVVRLALPAWASTVALGLGLALALVALVYVIVYRPSYWPHRAKWRTVLSSREGQGSVLRWCVGPLLLSALFLVTYWAWFGGSGAPAGDVPYMDLPGATRFVGVGAALHVAAWVIASAMLRRLNWKLELPVTLVSGALGGLIVWVGATQLLPDPAGNPRVYVCFAVPLFLALFLLAATLFVGLVSPWTTDEDREWWARFGGWLLIALVGWVVVTVLAIFGPDGLLYFEGTMRALIPSVGGVSGLIALLIGKSGATPGSEKQAEKRGGVALGMDYAAQLAAPVFVAVFLAVLSLGASVMLRWLWQRGLAAGFFLDGVVPPTDWLDHAAIVRSSPLILSAGFLLGLLVLGVGMGLFVNVNKFSLHSMYRNRLIRAYLGASRPVRTPNPFTGFDPDDNVQMHELRSTKLLHVVNVALNLVGGENLAWQQRKAESFTVSPLASGSHGVGYRSSRYYGGLARGISLGTAVTISGAAASPNMGYHSSPVVTFLMTLFNARLGWWLGNPGPHGDRHFHRSHPWFSISPMITEAFGLTDDRHPYVYLSDGGHFENLGLYEMVLRRCHVIVVSDAGCDPGCALEDLGNAIRKVRIDFGVPIVLEKLLIYSRARAGALTGAGGRYCALGTIGYSAVDGTVPDGVLIYLKPAVYGDEPKDIFNYAEAHTVFPHEPTSDQWFSESQFESYRALGAHAVETIVGTDWRGATLEDLARRVGAYVDGRVGPEPG